MLFQLSRRSVVDGSTCGWPFIQGCPELCRCSQGAQSRVVSGVQNADIPVINNMISRDEEPVPFMDPFSSYENNDEGNNNKSVRNDVICLVSQYKCAMFS